MMQFYFCKLFVWNQDLTQAVLKYYEHTAAVKPIAWSPHLHGLLASGGGTADRYIHFGIQPQIHTSVAWALGVSSTSLRFAICVEIFYHVKAGYLYCKGFYILPSPLIDRQLLQEQVMKHFGPVLEYISLSKNSIRVKESSDQDRQKGLIEYVTGICLRCKILKDLIYLSGFS
ncbi:hypothetical protein MKW98_011102 [Papaver atlanticum]|uniref:Uncharacterized protein n=1 Tax=Papaver atlanticum TaxID=357466 RepID=A0AAD4TK66_9MAGN|nr:hypothetical protein MKW98_011102 [Papaver atlanticum]